MWLVLCRSSKNDAVENDRSRRGESSLQASLRGSIYSETCMQRRSKAGQRNKTDSAYSWNRKKAGVACRW